MSSWKKLFVWFNRDQGKYLMVSEWTSNPRQLININYWQRKQLEIIKYHGQLSFLREISMEGHDNLGSHMVGRQTLQLEKLQLWLITYSRQLVWLSALKLPRTLFVFVNVIVVPEEEGCIVSMHSNCEQIRENWCSKTGMNLLVTFLDIMPLSLRQRDSLKLVKLQSF